MRRFVLTVIFTGLFGASAAHAFEAAGHEGWTNDWEAAKKQAAEEGKDLLIDFTGSDWCGWCIRLNKEVFDKAAFKKEAPKHFVLVELDFPNRKKQSAELKAQNQKLKNRFSIRGFPTILLADAQGRPYAKTGYKRGGESKYLEHLEELRTKKAKRDELFKAAEGKEGLERAKALDAALSYLAEQGVKGGYSGVVDEIKKLDKDNEAGLYTKYVIPAEIDKIQSAFRKSRNADQALEAYEKLLAEKKLPGEIQQKIYYNMAVACDVGKKGLPMIIENLEKAQKADPDSKMGQRLAKMVGRLKKVNQKNQKKAQ
ncbi:MAG: thioredoxin family protein [Phycisphaeraceae bacterium]|nr:thioredoxin family protein [Phycisphaeraceae bacterium]